MTALVLVFCLQSAPSSCIEERPAETLAPAACLMQAQQYAASFDHHASRLIQPRVCQHSGPTAPFVAISPQTALAAKPLTRQAVPRLDFARIWQRLTRPLGHRIIRCRV